eukprot:1389169-Prymnesium_polylepis.1
MAHHLQGTLIIRGVQWDPQNTFLLVYGKSECRLAERSSNLPLTSNFNYGEARTSSLKVEPAFAASTECTPRTRRARVWAAAPFVARRRCADDAPSGRRHVDVQQRRHRATALKRVASSVGARAATALSLHVSQQRAVTVCVTPPKFSAIASGTQ